MNDKIEQIINDMNQVKDLNELYELKVKYLGKKGIISDMALKMKDLSSEEKREFGKAINNMKSIFQENFAKFSQKFELEKINKKLTEEQVDITLPGTRRNMGSAHMLEKTIEELEELFIAMGYDVVEGPEVEQDLYNFEMLNLPKGHPARDAQDTFYIDKEEVLLRSHTSPVQVRTMLKNHEKTPIRIVCPGKTYRRDNDDASHSHQFMQMEGLLVDKEVSLADLKGTLDTMIKSFFGDDRKTRFRPSFYPFTEPSVEYDVTCFKCGSKGCPICKHTGWVTVGGAGIVHPNVLKMSGYDPDIYTGFAFGFGMERLTMLKYGVSDIRTFYINDLRSNKQFARRGDNNEN